MGVLLVVVFFVLIFFITKKNTFSACFIALALTYILFFYGFPLAMLYGMDYYYYAGNIFYLTSDVYVDAAAALIVFVLGFFLIDALKIAGVFRKRHKVCFETVHDCRAGLGELYEGKGRSFTRLFWFFFIVVVLYLVLGVVDSDRAISGYDIRRGMSEGSRIMFFISIVLSALLYVLLMSAAQIRKTWVVALLSLVALAYMLTGSTGRANLLFLMLMCFLYFSKIKVRYLVLLATPALLIVLPIIIGMKDVIYSISVDSEVPDFYEVYSRGLDLDKFISNFGHPLVSYFQIEGLIEKVGYRFFYDYIQGFLFYLKAFGLPVSDSLIYYNTENLLGRKASIIPTGYVVFGFMQLSYVGVLVSGIFYRSLGFLVEFIYKKMDFDSEVAKFYFTYSAASTFYHGEIRVMVMTFFVPLIVVFLFSPKMIKTRTGSSLKTAKLV